MARVRHLFISLIRLSLIGYSVRVFSPCRLEESSLFAFLLSPFFFLSTSIQSTRATRDRIDQPPRSGTRPIDDKDGEEDIDTGDTDIEDIDSQISNTLDIGGRGNRFINKGLQSIPWEVPYDIDLNDQDIEKRV